MRPFTRVSFFAGAALGSWAVLTACGSSSSSPATSTQDGGILDAGPGVTVTGPVSPILDAGTRPTDAGSADSGAHPADAGVDAGSQGTGRATGTYNDTTLSGISNALSEVISDSKGTSAELVITALTTCRDVTAGPSADAQIIHLSLYTIDDGTGRSVAPTAPGTFDLDLSSDGPFAIADFTSLYPTCLKNSDESGVFDRGTVTLIGASSTSLSGTFDLFAGADEVRGSFITVSCAGASTLASPTSTTGCH